MNVYLENGEQVRGDLIAEWVLRSDLVPVPRTLELAVQETEVTSEYLAEGKVITTGTEMLKYQIVHVVRPSSSGAIQGDRVLALIQVTALLQASHKIAFRSPRAVIKERKTLGEIYRSCGGETSIADDFTVDRFCCFAGDVPSYPIAMALQEEAGAIVIRNGKLSFLRIADMTKQKPVASFDQVDNFEAVESGYLERNEIASFFSTDDSGAFVAGDKRKTRAVVYAPRAGTRVLFNMSRSLVLKRVARIGFASYINAGDVVSIMGEPMVVITAAHVCEQGENAGITQSYTRLWLGVPA